MKSGRLLEIAAMVILAGLGAWLLITRPMDDRLDVMLPEDPGLLQSMRLLEDAQLTGKVIVQVERTGAGIAHTAFVDHLNRLVTRLAGLPSPQISRILTPATVMPDPADMRVLGDLAPQLIPASAYPELEQRLSEDNVRSALKAIRRELIGPQAMVLSQWFRSDPLGIRAKALEPMQNLKRSMGYRTVISDGHFFSEDMQAAMLILETPVRITDHASSRQLIDSIRDALKEMPPELRCSIVSGHLHTLSNQRILRRDIGWADTLATFFFAGLFLIGFRDVRAFLVFLLPVVGILMGLGVILLANIHLALVVLGLAGMLAGIAVDYGIHVFVALSSPACEEQRDVVLKRVRKPLCLGVVTTLGALTPFMLSQVPGYRQLGLLAAATLLFCLFLAVRMLPLSFPAVLRPPRRKHKDAPQVLRHPTAPARLVVACYLALLTFGIVMATGVRLDLDFTHLDGTEESILRDEAAFLKRWTSEEETEVLAVWDRDPERAREANDIICESIGRKPGGLSAFSSIAPVWPAESTRRERSAMWQEFWKRNREPLREKLTRLAPEYGFTPGAFDSFIESLDNGTGLSQFNPTNRFFSTMERIFVRTGNDRTVILSFFDSKTGVRDALAALPSLPAETACISRRDIQSQFSSSTFRELSRQALTGLVLMGTLIVILVRGVRERLLVCVPPLTGAVGMLAGLSLAGRPLSPVSLMAILLVVGVCIDYGVFMLEAWRFDTKAEIGHSLLLSWITNAGGAALLLVAHHPVLFSMGLALTLGVTCGYLAARYAVWPLAAILKTPKAQEKTP